MKELWILLKKCTTGPVKAWGTWVALLSIMKCALPLLNLVATGYLVDSLSKGGAKPLWGITVFLGAALLSTVHKMVFAWTRKGHTLALEAALALEILDHRSALVYRAYEDTKTQELVHRATDEGGRQFIDGFYNWLDLLDIGVQVLTVVAMIMTKNGFVALLGVTGFAVMWPLVKRCGQEDYQAFQEASVQFRRAKYFRQVLTDRDHAKERHLFQYSGAVNDMWEGQYAHARGISDRATGKNYMRLKLASSLMTLLAFFIAVILVWPLQGGSLSVGLYAALVTRTFSLSRLMSWRFGQQVEAVMKALHFTMDYERFMGLEVVDLTDSRVAPEKRAETFESLEFRDVSFRYGSEEDHAPYILRHLSFKISAGGSYAFVGENGAGKSTIIKLILGLYSHYEGGIYVNGVEMRQGDRNAAIWKNWVSAVFQDYPRYPLTVEENLLMGRATLNDDYVNGKGADVLDLLGLKTRIEAMPKGFQTKLGRLSEDSLDLSGGEWQRLAIARALLRDSPLYILDEPSAALDPIFEAQLYQTLGAYFEAQGRTTILVTHRMGAVVDADQIFVIEPGGGVIESGTHPQLMQKAGHYANLYTTQREWYVA